MEERTNYGKIFAITLAVIGAASAIAFVIYNLTRRFYDACCHDEFEVTDLDLCELEELDQDLEEDAELLEEEATVQE